MLVLRGHEGSGIRAFTAASLGDVFDKQSDAVVRIARCAAAEESFEASLFLDGYHELPVLTACGPTAAHALRILEGCLEGKFDRVIAKGDEE